MKEVFGVRPLRCERCVLRFSAFTPVLRVSEPKPERKAPVTFDLVSRRSQLVPDSASPLSEIQLIELEWQEKIQPDGLVEQTLCAQLAHATWHLRCLHLAEREALASAVSNRCFNGESVMSLMTWRRAAESSIQTALQQLQGYRQVGPSRGPTPQLGTSDLLALSEAVDPTATEHHLAFAQGN